MLFRSHHLALTLLAEHPYVLERADISTVKSHILSPPLDDVLGGKNAGQLVGGCLVSALEHRARALLGRRKGGQNVGGRTGQTDGALVDQGVILQGLVGHGDQRLAHLFITISSKRLNSYRIYIFEKIS